jgi:sulfonate transport system ATP-binding protein
MNEIQGASERTLAQREPALVSVDGVTLQYKTPNHLVTATYRVSLDIHKTDRLVLLGPSGCGKSTLLKAIAGFLKPVEGSITLKGRPIDGPGPDRMMVFQEFDQLLPWKTVSGNVVFPSTACRATKRERGRATPLPRSTSRNSLTPIRTCCRAA